MFLDKMNKWLEILIGLVLVIGSIYVWGINLFDFGKSALVFLKGGIIWAIILIGVILIFLGISELKE